MTDIDVIELLEPVFDEFRDLRVGWPDERTRVRESDPEQLRSELTEVVVID